MYVSRTFYVLFNMSSTCNHKFTRVINDKFTRPDLQDVMDIFFLKSDVLPWVRNLLSYPLVVWDVT